MLSEDGGSSGSVLSCTQAVTCTGERERRRRRGDEEFTVPPHHFQAMITGSCVSGCSFVEVI